MRIHALAGTSSSNNKVIRGSMLKNGNMPKVVFVSPEDSVYSFGLRLLSSIAKKNSYESFMVFMPTVYDTYSKREMKQLVDICRNSLAICITSSAINFKKATQIAQSLKTLGIPLVIGGIHATLNPEECLRYADFVCVGEGDYALPELLESIRKKDKVFKIKNIYYKKHGKIITNKIRTLVSNLDKLPFPDYDRNTKFILFKGKIIPLEECHLAYGDHNFSNMFFLPFGPVALYHTSRGCLYTCKYCCNKDLKFIYKNKGKFVRFISPANVIQGLKYVLKMYPCLEFIWFTDDDFFIRRIDKLKVLCNEYKKQIKLPFMCYLTPNSISREKLKTLVEAGLRRVEAGIQTGSDTINRKVYSRGITCQDITRMAFLLNKYKPQMYTPEYQVINTSPMDGEEDVLKTIRLVRELPKPFTLKVFNLVFFPGSLFEKEYLGRSVENFSEFNYVSHFKHFTKKGLKNRYFSAILSLMEGFCTDAQCGSLPTRHLNILLDRKIAWLGNKFPFLSYLLIFTHLNSLKVYHLLPHPKLKQIYLRRKVWVCRRKTFGSPFEVRI
jgi:radical SAM superfamily enzyme YgiQ (UPF0313 family)